MKYTWTNLITILTRLQNYDFPKVKNLQKIKKDDLSVSQIRSSYILQCKHIVNCYSINFTSNEFIKINSLVEDTGYIISKDMDGMDEITYTLTYGRVTKDIKFIIDALTKLGI